MLDFIGDGVLAIFPYDDAEQQKVAIEAATDALPQRDQGARRAERSSGVEQGLFPIRFGIGLNTGKVMFGNIGVPERLTFSVIGPTVNEVSRIESLTKATGMDALVTQRDRRAGPENWISIGKQRLAGVSEEMELFTFAKDKLAIPVDFERIELKASAKN